MLDRIYHCPVEVTVDVLGGKWTPVVLAHIKGGPLRYSEIRRLIPDITEKMLTERLRDLEARGIVSRTTVSDAPSHVEYQLTVTGESLRPVLQAMYDWGEKWADRQALNVERPQNLT